MRWINWLYGVSHSTDFQISLKHNIFIQKYKFYISKEPEFWLVFKYTNYKGSIVVVLKLWAKML